MNIPHNPVLLDEVIEYLNPIASKIFIDATFGAGGYSRAILSRGAAKLYAIDRDPNSEKFANEISNLYPNNFKFINSNFSEIGKLYKENFLEKCDGIIFDLGVSSMQLDETHRGFSFNKNAPLDMRMSCKGETASDFINIASEEFIADIIYNYGDERYSRRIAKSIIQARKIAPIETTLQLAEIVRKSIPHKNNGKIDLATKTFQAIRIYINDELLEIDTSLKSVGNLLKTDGKLVTISFHALEDIIVKNFLRDNSSAKKTANKYNIKTINQEKSLFRIINKKVTIPTKEEIKRNPRARSARVRAAIRTSYDQGEYNNVEF